LFSPEGQGLLEFPFAGIDQAAALPAIDDLAAFSHIIQGQRNGDQIDVRQEFMDFTARLGTPAQYFQDGFGMLTARASTAGTPRDSLLARISLGSDSSTLGTSPLPDFEPVTCQ